jgi:hypothetical protein
MFSQSQPSRPQPSRPKQITLDLGTWLSRYVAVIVKNVVGYLLMLGALVLGGLFPIPIGTPMFLIGFAMITLPGKRRLTSGALRGKQIGLFSRTARIWRLGISLLLPPAFILFLEFQKLPTLHPSRMSLGRLCTVYGLAIAGSWFLMLFALLFVNALLRILPRVRRRVRPWMRDHGVNLLPPRRKPRGVAATQQRPDDEQIVEFSRAHRNPKT